MNASATVVRAEWRSSWHNRGAVSEVSQRSRHRLLAGPGVVAVVAASDPGSTRVVYAMVVGLAIIGVLLVAIGIWLIRQTRVDPPMLGPLERMGERDWLRKDGPTQRRLLDEVRPDGASPLRSEPDPPRFDTEFGERHPPASLSDLGPGLAEPKSPTPPAPPRPDLDELGDGIEPEPDEPEDDEPADDEPADDEPEDDRPEDDEADDVDDAEHSDPTDADAPRPSPEISW